MKVCFVKTGKAFLPELNAYVSYLKKNNIETVICDDIEQARKVDATIYYRFGGLLNRQIKVNIPEIHEYHTISTGKFPLFKNIIKSLFSVTPNGLSFLNPLVESKYYFKNNIPKIYRDMGADIDFLNVRNYKEDKIYDIAYIGSISTRVGLVDIIEKIAIKDITIVLIGNISTSDKNKLLKYNNITMLGVCSKKTIIDTLSKAKFGLNYIPDIYPLNIQTSTKIIEYLVAGIPIISNKYSWIEEHSKLHNYEYIDINELNFKTKKEYVLDVDDVNKFYWDSILNEVDFISFIKRSQGVCLLKN